MHFRDRHFWLVISAGALLGICGVLLSIMGNPQNSGICISCFIENSAGALGFHNNTRMQYLRPELIGFVLGSLAAAGGFREFRSRGGSAPLPRLFAGIFLIVGCAVFIGCPIKLLLRLSAGDLTAVAGVAGLVAGVWAGLKALESGVTVGSPTQHQGRGGGLLVPGLFAALLIFAVVRPGFLVESQTGSGAQHAPWLISLGVGLVLGAIAQRTRFCITGSVRDALLMGGRTPLLWGLAAFFITSLAANALTGEFNAGLYGQPGAHHDHLWSFFGMLLVGAISVLVGGCPFRQLIKSGEGDADAGLVVIGMFIGGAIVQTWGVASTAAGVSLYGKVALLVGIMFVLAWCLLYRERTSQGAGSATAAGTD